MEVSYEHANPHRGNESFLIRVEEAHEDRVPCLLVDAGDGVDVDALLDEDEYLVAILLTHAHVDHYQSLDDAYQPGTRILTSPDTAAVLDDVLAEGERHFGLENTDVLLEQVEALSDWESVLGEDDISVRPVPAGHAPGACGFLIRIRDGDDEFRVLATGDFTLRDAAGYPGFDPSSYLDVDAVFLTAATAEAADERLTDIVGTVAERVNAGSRTLCTTSGLTGIHLATLFAAVDEELDYSLPAILVGQVAKLYEELGYDHPNVETVPEFSDPATCLEPGAVTVAGPEVPVEGSSGRLFEELDQDPNAALVQVQGGSTTAKNAGDFAGTVESFTFSNHADEDALDEVVETISPTHVVVEHQSGRSLQPYKEKWDVFSWATGDTGQETLYRDGTFVPPRWVGDAVKRRVRARDGQTTAVDASDDVLEVASALPALDRRETPSLEAEGVDVQALRDRLYIDSTPPSTPATTAPSGPGEQDGETNVRQSLTDGGLHRTVGADLSDSKVDVSRSADDNDAESTASPLVDTVSPSAPKSVGTSGRDGESGGSHAEGPATSDTESEGERTEETAEETAETAAAEDPPEETATDDRDDEGVTAETEDLDAVSAKSTAAPAETGDTLTFEVDPGVRALAEHRAAASEASLDGFVYDAVESYLADALRGNEPESARGEPVERALTVDADPALEGLLAAAADATGTDDIDSFVLDTLCETLGFDPDDRTLTVVGLASLTTLVDAVTENDDCPHDTRDEVVQAALEEAVL